MQSGDFLYMTGITQSGVLAAITAGSDGRAPRFTLFTPPREPERELWDGTRLRPEAAAEVFGADEAYPSTEVCDPSLLFVLDIRKLLVS